VQIILKNGNPRFIKLISTQKAKALEYANELGNLIETKVLNYTENNYRGKLIKNFR
jgi:hypothetical protein